MNYALIAEGVVVNIISLHPMNADAFPNAVPTNDLPVSIGDTYLDGVFYHDGTAIIAPNNKDEEYADMQDALSMLEVRLNG